MLKYCAGDYQAGAWGSFSTATAAGFHSNQPAATHRPSVPPVCRSEGRSHDLHVSPETGRWRRSNLDGQGHCLCRSAAKTLAGNCAKPECSSLSQMLGIPVSSTLQSAVKQVAISSGQILVAKGSPSVNKVMGGKQVLAQGVAKAIVSGASGLSSQPATAKAAGSSSGKSGGQRSRAHNGPKNCISSSI